MVVGCGSASGNALYLIVQGTLQRVCFFLLGGTLNSVQMGNPRDAAPQTESAWAFCRTAEGHLNLGEASVNPRKAIQKPFGHSASCVFYKCIVFTKNTHVFLADVMRSGKIRPYF